MIVRKLMNTVNFEAEFYDFVKKYVPNIIITDKTWSAGHFKDLQVSQQVLDKISWWLFEGDQSKVLDQLAQLNNPSVVCGRIFKPGEATYTCRECAMDPTCVFCQRCFRQSPHINHKYKLHSSGGGGCCDCGDVEAWTKFPCCNLHGLENTSNMVDAMQQFPDALCERAKKLFQVIFEYIIDSLTKNRTALPEYLISEHTTDTFLTMVFNDESHTFDHVIDVLKGAVKCSSDTASDFATIIDREGRTVISVGSKSECTTAHFAIMSGLQHRSGPLKTMVMHSAVVAHQEFSLALLQWISLIVQQSEGLRHIVSNILLQVKGDDEAFVTKLMLADTSLWKVVRSAYHQVIMSSILIQADHKKSFARKYAKVYKRLMNDYMEDDHHHIDSITSMSVQLFTVPTVVKYLIVEEDLLELLLHTVVTYFCNETNTNSGQLKYTLDDKQLRKNFQRIHFCFYDLNYALNNVPAEAERRVMMKFKSFFKMFIGFLSSLEGMGSIVRKVIQHQEHDPEWETGVTLCLRLIPIIKKIFRWCSLDKDLLFYFMEETVALLKFVHQNENGKRMNVQYNDTQYDCLDYDITKKPVSVHYPLTRFAAGLLVQLGKLDISFEKISDSIFRIAECAFRSLSLSAQVTAGAWRRNGIALVNQVYYYRGRHCKTETFFRDIHMLQCCAALIDPDHFFVSLSHKLNLIQVQNMHEYRMSLYEDLVTLLIYVCAERYTEGVGQVTPETITRRDIIHILASGPKPHSVIHKHLCEEISNENKWETILQQIANRKTSSTIKSAAYKYELKSECLEEVSPYCYHYDTATQQTNVHNEILRRKKSNNQSLVFVPQPSPPFTKPFAQVINVLLCSSFVVFLKNTLEMYLVKDSKELQWSNKLFEKLIYLIGFAVVEERERVKKNPHDYFQFCQRFDGIGALGCLKKLIDEKDVSIHHDSIHWLLGTIDDVSKRREGVHVDTDVLPSLPTVNDEQEMLKRKQKAEKRKQSLLRQITQQQKQFVERNAMEIDVVVSQKSEPGSSSTTPRKEDPVCTSLSWQLSSMASDLEPQMCIVCQDVDDSEECLVMAAFVQLSSVLSKPKYFTDVEDILVGASNHTGIHVSTCSHIMHYSCWEQHVENIKSREQRRPFGIRYNGSSFFIYKNEFPCPLCSRLSNCIIPLISHATVARKRGVSQSSSDNISIHDWLQLIEKYIDPPKLEKQEVVIKLHPEAPALHSVANEENIAPEKFPEVSNILQSYVVTIRETSLESAFDSMFQCFKKTCLILERKISKDACHPLLMLWHSAVTTFQVQECVSRYKGNPLLALPPIRVEQALGNIVRCCFEVSKSKKDECKNQQRAKLKLILGRSDRSLLHTNIFNTFVTLVFSCECLRANLNCSSINSDQSTLFLCALAQIVQIMLYVDVEEVIGEPNEDSTLVQCFNQVRSYANMPLCNSINHQKLENCIYFCFDPFLRSCALFMRYVTNVMPSQTLEQKDDRVAFCNYLNLPVDILAYFDACGTTSLEPLVQRWCFKVLEVDASRNPSYPHYAKVNTLLELEEDYSDTIADASDFVCPRFGGDSDSISPTKCLMCGTMLCSQSYCCQKPFDGINVGACTHHSYECSYGHGMFLRGRDCTIILLNGNRGCFRPAPYLDEHGETDQGLRRGNPMKLDKRMFKELNLMWLNHDIPESIARDMDANRSFIHQDWIQL